MYSSSVVKRSQTRTSGLHHNGVVTMTKKKMYEAAQYYPKPPSTKSWRQKAEKVAAQSFKP